MVVIVAPTRSELATSLQSVVLVENRQFHWGAPIWPADETGAAGPEKPASPDVRMLGVLYGRNSG